MSRRISNNSFSCLSCILVGLLLCISSCSVVVVVLVNGLSLNPSTNNGNPQQKKRSLQLFHASKEQQQEQPKNDKKKQKPKLCLIGGCPGTSKSTFGMSVALDQGILKCISTNTVRAEMRSFIPKHISPALHRSSYDPPAYFQQQQQQKEKKDELLLEYDHDDDPVRSWMDTCRVLEPSLKDIVLDSIDRGQGLVLEGVSMVPSTKFIQLWEERGGVATGVLLTIPNEEAHKLLLLQQQQQQQKRDLEEKMEKKIQSFHRVRLLQEEMIRCATESGWTLIKQKIEPDPLEIINALLEEEKDCDILAHSFQFQNDNTNNGASSFRMDLNELFSSKKKKQEKKP